MYEIHLIGTVLIIFVSQYIYTIYISLVNMFQLYEQKFCYNKYNYHKIKSYTLFNPSCQLFLDVHQSIPLSIKSLQWL